jgi:hypothetical protein
VSREGNAYRLERRGANGTPSQIQVQIWLLYEALADQLNVSSAGLMDETLAAHFCPFRSAAWDSLHNGAESIAFSRELWWSILEIARPSVLLCLGDSARHLEDILRRRGSRRVGQPARLPDWLGGRHLEAEAATSWPVGTRW